jgi:hypothetical protein
MWRAMSYMWRSHVTYVQESCHICEPIMSHMWRSHVTYVMKESYDTWVTYVMKESCDTCVTYVMKESCDTWQVSISGDLEIYEQLGKRRYTGSISQKSAPLSFYIVNSVASRLLRFLKSQPHSRLFSTSIREQPVENFYLEICEQRLIECYPASYLCTIM